MNLPLLHWIPKLHKDPYNLMWILKNSKQLLGNLQSQSSHINSIRTFDLSTLYTNIPHDK